MRIETIHVDGFGLFHDLRITAIPPGISVFYGDNEAGKSTLLAFVRAILFGFLDGRSRSENLYPPLHGGKHGGSLVLFSLAGDRYVVARQAGARGGPVRVTLPDGSLGNQQALSQLLGNATRDLYRNIFAFSLAELQQFESLGDEKVRSTIYSAGLGTGGVSVPTVEKALDNALQNAFKAGGSKPVINQILGELDQIHGELQGKAKDIGRYDALHGQLAVVDTEIATLRADRQEAERRQASAAQFLMAWDDWIALRAATKALAELPVIDAFPPEGITRLQNAETRLAELSDQLAAAETDLQAAKDEHDHLDVDEHVLQQSEAIDQLYQGRGRYDEALQNVPVLELQVKAAEEALAEGLRELGPDWNGEKLASFDTSIAEHEAIRRHREAIRTAGEAWQASRIRQEAAERVLAEARTAEKEAGEAFAAFPPALETDTTVLSGRYQTLQTLASRLRELPTLQERLRHLEEREADLQLQKRLALQRSSERRQLPFWPAAPMGVLPVAMGLIAALFVPGIGGLVVFLLGVLLGLGVAALYLVWRAFSRPSAGNDDGTTEQAADIEQRLADLGQQKDETAHRQAQILQEAVQTRAALGIDGPLDETVADRLIEEVRQALEMQRRWAEARQTLARAAARLEKAREEYRQEAAAAETAQAVLDQARQSWAAWLAAAGLREDLSPDGATEAFASVRGCREKTKVIRELRERLSLADNVVAAYREGVTSVAAACGQPVAPGADLGIAVDHLSGQLQTARENRYRREELLRNIQRDGAQVERLRQQKAEWVQSLAALLAEGGAATPEEFRQRADLWGQRQVLWQDIRQRNLALERIAGQEEHLAALKEQLALSTRAEQEQVKREAEEMLARLEQASAAKSEQRGSILRQIEELEADDEAAQLRLTEEVLLTRLRDEARQWAVVMIAKHLLSEARDRYERERQPGVVKDASQFFTQITAGEYRQILASPEDATLHVLNKHDRPKQMDVLSRGTKEQLYYAVRLGLIREFNRRQEPLPVVADDIFVNFDPHRAAAALRALLALAATNQVLLFTCHPETCELVHQIAPETPMFRLPDGQRVLMGVEGGTVFSF